MSSSGCLARAAVTTAHTLGWGHHPGAGWAAEHARCLRCHQHKMRGLFTCSMGNSMSIMAFPTVSLHACTKGAKGNFHLFQGCLKPKRWKESQYFFSYNNECGKHLDLWLAAGSNSNVDFNVLSLQTNSNPHALWQEYLWVRDITDFDLQHFLDNL